MIKTSQYNPPANRITKWVETWTPPRFSTASCALEPTSIKVNVGPRWTPNVVTNRGPPNVMHMRGMSAGYLSLKSVWAYQPRSSNPAKSSSFWSPLAFRFGLVCPLYYRLLLCCHASQSCRRQVLIAKYIVYTVCSNGDSGQRLPVPPDVHPWLLFLCCRWTLSTGLHWHVLELHDHQRIWWTHWLIGDIINDSRNYGVVNLPHLDLLY